MIYAASVALQTIVLMREVHLQLLLGNLLVQNLALRLAMLLSQHSLPRLGGPEGILHRQAVSLHSRPLAHTCACAGTRIDAMHWQRYVCCRRESAKTCVAPANHWQNFADMLADDTASIYAFPKVR